MLNSTALKSDLKSIFDDVLPDALECALNSMADFKSEELEKRNKEFADMFTEMVSQPLAERLAACIDHYIKTGCIFGTIITAGSPVTQTAVIAPGTPCGMAIAGKVPNTLGMM